MTLKTALIILCFDVYQTHCNETEPLDYYEFRLKHGDIINYEELVNKVTKRNKTSSNEVYGTDWQDFTDNTHILLNLPGEQDDNDTSTPGPRNVWNFVEGAQMLTFQGDDWHRTSPVVGDETWISPDLTAGITLFANYTLAAEKLYYEGLTATKTTQKSQEETYVRINIQDHTDNDIFFDVNDTWLEQYRYNTSEEEKKYLNLQDFYNFTVTTVAPPTSTWNPFLIQSEERQELDRIAKEKRMATNNMMRDQIKSGNFGGLGGLFGGLGGLGGVIPVNLGGLMGGLRTITLVMNGGGTVKSTTGGITTTAKSTISRKTFRPRPDPKDFMAWKYLEDGSPRPPMYEDEFIRILKKHGTPPPYYIPPMSIPAGLGDDVLDLIPNENTTIPINIEPDQLDRIHNFMNPFIQQHTAMDLLNVNNAGRFTPGPSTLRTRYTGEITTESQTTTTTTTPPPTTTTTTTTRRPAETWIFTTRPTYKPQDDSWKHGWSRTYSTIDPFDQENLQRALNEGVKGNHPWREITFKTLGTFAPHTDPRVAELEKDFVAVDFKGDQAKRISQAVHAKEEMFKQYSKDKEKRQTKPSYWKEVIFKRPIEPLFDKPTSTAPKTAELRHLFSLLSQGLTSYQSSNQSKKYASTTSHVTSSSPSHSVHAQAFPHMTSTTQRTHSMYWTLNEQNHPLSLELNKRTQVSHGVRQAEATFQQTNYHDEWRKETITLSSSCEKNKDTTPQEERERLQTILSFMFPYVQRKGDIFGTQKDTQTSTVRTTVFDPWETQSNEDKPIIPDLGKLFERFPMNQTDRFR